MNNAITTKQKAHKLLEDQGFNYITDLPYCTTFTGFDFYIGINDKENKAGIVALMDDEENYFLCKEDVKEMAVTARIQGVKEVTLYTDFGLELHSKHETPKTVGLDKICKLTGWEFGSLVLFASDNGGFITMGETTTKLQEQKKEETKPETPTMQWVKASGNKEETEEEETPLMKATDLIPEIIAGKFREEQYPELEQHLIDRANRHWNNDDANFRKVLSQKGARGRDALYAFMDMWSKEYKKNVAPKN